MSQIYLGGGITKETADLLTAERDAETDRANGWYDKHQVAVARIKELEAGIRMLAFPGASATAESMRLYARTLLSK